MPEITYIEKVTKFFTSISLILIVAEYFNATTYYFFFNIEISEYLTSSELLFSSINNLIIIALAFLVQLLIWKNLFVDRKIEYTNQPLLKKVILFLTSNAFSLFRLLIRVVVFLVLTVATVVLLFLLYKNQNSILIINFCTFLIVNFVSFIIWAALKKLFTKYESSIESLTYLKKSILMPSLLFIVSIIIGISFKNFAITNSLKKHGNPSQVKLFLDKDTVTTSANNILIGKTDKYYFVWDKTTTKTTIYPSSALKKIVR